ncbi:uncharacterized protein BO95DRAFT_6396 [Aspergillus brunneoviolaceus CBS 621.78]|uniref:Uncharacterized protein n=1 Tax=Aspergillus brunneoviolaceus CBS 621.78 TaxID=1450534 RepID=A0ACD1GR68_9EURO|nr:hypothetical protein BO95DRAFT_6396 [Aspergillus brunneoviolaceus CBS 621.78]RAH51571.1 hypothetical protein BO95DRAFT_6396 [Aspergillus brunneoviolaceus CBS 621.78]
MGWGVWLVVGGSSLLMHLLILKIILRWTCVAVNCVLNVCRTGSSLSVPTPSNREPDKLGTISHPILYSKWEVQ